MSVKREKIEVPQPEKSVYVKLHFSKAIQRGGAYVMLIFITNHEYSTFKVILIALSYTMRKQVLNENERRFIFKLLLIKKSQSTFLRTRHSFSVITCKAPHIFCILSFLSAVNMETPWLPVQDTFLGCLKDVKINEKPLLISRLSDIHGIVSLQGCPAN